MALLLTRDDQISQDLIDEHDRFRPSSSGCIQFEIQAALIPDQNKFEYQTAQNLVKTVQGFLRSLRNTQYIPRYHRCCGSCDRKEATSSRDNAHGTLHFREIVKRSNPTDKTWFGPSFYRLQLCA